MVGKKIDRQKKLPNLRHADVRFEFYSLLKYKTCLYKSQPKCEKQA